MSTQQTLEIDRIVRLPELKRLTGLSHATLYELARVGDFPRPIKLARRAKGWRLGAVRDWITKRERESMAEPYRDACSETGRAALAAARAARAELATPPAKSAA